MRINIYEEELTDEVTYAVKNVPQGGGVVETFYGLRFYLESPQAILDHSTPEDDDRNAITLWVRYEGINKLYDLLERASADALDMIPLREERAGRSD